MESVSILIYRVHKEQNYVNRYLSHDAEDALMIHGTFIVQYNT